MWHTPERLTKMVYGIDIDQSDSVGLSNDNTTMKNKFIAAVTQHMLSKLNRFQSCFFFQQKRRLKLFHVQFIILCLGTMDAFSSLFWCNLTFNLFTINSFFLSSSSSSFCFTKFLHRFNVIRDLICNIFNFITFVYVLFKFDKEEEENCTNFQLICTCEMYSCSSGEFRCHLVFDKYK